MNKFYIEYPYSANPKVYQYPVDGIDEGALVVVDIVPVLKTLEKAQRLAMWSNNRALSDILDKSISELLK